MTRLVSVFTALFWFGSGVAAADCGPVRDPGDVAALVQAGAIDAELGKRLLPLAEHRQGAAATLLVQRYSVGKTASAGGSGATDERLAELRDRVERQAAELAFIDGEIARLLAGSCDSAL